MIAPSKAYQDLVAAKSHAFDENQVAALKVFDDLFFALIAKPLNPLKRIFMKSTPHQGIYLWGSVGVGKSFMLDLFYNLLSFPQKLRMHFHEFMRMIHVELKNQSGHKNPLKSVARDIAKKARVLCFDEFVVNDIADAMILGRLMQALYEEGVVFVATSNVSPDKLYLKGLQRALFLPTIALINQSTTVIHIKSSIDYRLRYLRDAGVFYLTQHDDIHHDMENAFAVMAGDEVAIEPVLICDRLVPVIKKSPDVIWFDFNVLCNIPRSTHDYLEIAKRYQTVFLSHIPIIPENANDRINLFIRLIDVLYDAKTRLVFSAAVPVADIYTQGRMVFEYERTKSRLIEMQSEDYFL